MFNIKQLLFIVSTFFSVTSPVIIGAFYIVLSNTSIVYPIIILLYVQKLLLCPKKLLFCPL